MTQPIIKSDIEARIQFSNSNFNETLNNIDLPISWQTLNGYKNEESNFNSAFYGGALIGPGPYSPQIVVGSKSVNSVADKQSVFVRRYITSYSQWSDWTELFTTQGGTIYNNLTIKKDSNPSLYLYNNTTAQQGIFQELDGGTLQMLNYTDGNNYNGIYIHKYSTGLSNSLVFVKKIDGTATSYNILHYGNLNNYTWNINASGEKIPDNADLNTYTTPGNYYSPGSTNSATHINPPMTNSGYKLIVEKSYTSKTIFQYAKAQSNLIYYRVYNDSGVWSDWNIIISNKNISSYALPLSGGTLTGQLNAHGNIYMKNTNPWILLNDSDSNVNFYVQASGSSIGIGNTWSKSLLINNTGKVTIQSETTIANNIPAQLIFSVKQTDNNITTGSGSIKYYDDHDAQNYGGTMVIHSAGNMVIGAGESPNTCYSTDLVGNTAENMYITSDNNIYFYTNCNTYANKKTTCYINTSGVLYGAAWNDYAEFRESDEDIQPGRVVKELGDGKLQQTNGRLEPGCLIVSDTFGYAIGQTEICNTPIAVSGRVLAYPNEDRYSYKPGDAVCSGPNGTVSKMTRKEIIYYPERIIGTVSEIPEYDTWGQGDVKVDNRIWISVK